MMITERLEAADVEQIYKFLNDYSTAINSGDIERILGFWHTDDIQRRKEEIKKFFDNLTTRSSTDILISPEVVQIFGNLAYAQGTWLFLNKGESEHIRNKIPGKFLSILKKETDGSWKILVDCFNYES